MFWIIICSLLIGYCFYEKHCETKQIECISRIEGLTFEEIEKLIDKIK
jgi:hypothetical protein